MPVEAMIWISKIMGLSWNRVTPSSHPLQCPIINHPFVGISFMETPICLHMPLANIRVPGANLLWHNILRSRLHDQWQAFLLTAALLGRNGRPELQLEMLPLINWMKEVKDHQKWLTISQIHTDYSYSYVDYSVCSQVCTQVYTLYVICSILVGGFNPSEKILVN